MLTTARLPCTFCFSWETCKCDIFILTLSLERNLLQRDFSVCIFGTVCISYRTNFNYLHFYRNIWAKFGCMRDVFTLLRQCWYDYSISCKKAGLWAVITSACLIYSEPGPFHISWSCWRFLPVKRQHFSSLLLVRGGGVSVSRVLWSI